MFTFKFRRGTALRWALTDPVLEKGEPGHEVDTGKFKIGDGLTRWSQLPAYLTEDAVYAAIQAASLGGGSSDETTPANLLDHINDQSPHPVYDEGPSFLLLYKNAKV